jgi:hypothetical protein
VSRGGGERHKPVPDPYYYESKTSTPKKLQPMDRKVMKICHGGEISSGG